MVSEGLFYSVYQLKDVVSWYTKSPLLTPPYLLTLGIVKDSVATQQSVSQLDSKNIIYNKIEPF